MQQFIQTRHAGGEYRHGLVQEFRFPENVQREFQDMVASVQSAWNLIKDKLKDNGRTTL